MPKIVAVPGLGNVEFPDSMSDVQISSAIESDILPKIGTAKAPVGRGGVLASGAESFLTGITDIPGGIAGLFYEKPEETPAGRFSEQARAGIQSALGINPQAEPTMAETGAMALGSVASFLVPYAGQEAAAARLLGGVGEAATAARAIGRGVSATQAIGLGAQQQIQDIKQQEAAGKQISGEDKLAATRWGGAIGLADLLPLERFVGPLEAVLTKVPLAKAGGVSKIVENGIKKALVSGTEEGAQEAISQLAQNIVEQGYYNPDLSLTDGLLSNAGAGGFAGGTMDVLLQLATGRKSARARTAYNQLAQKTYTEAKQGSEEAIRADAINGLNTLRTAAPIGNLAVRREQMLLDNGDTQTAFHVVGEDNNPIATFSTPDAAVLAAQQYEKDATGLAKFNAPTAGDMASNAALEDTTPEEKSAGKEIAKEMKAAGALEPAPATTATTPAGQAATEDTIAKAADDTGAAPTDLALPAAPTKPKKSRIPAALEVTPPAAEQPLVAPPEASQAPVIPALKPKTPTAAAVPSFEEVRAALPKDSEGNPDLATLNKVVADVKGQPTPWAQLTDAEKSSVLSQVAPATKKLVTPQGEEDIIGEIKAAPIAQEAKSIFEPRVQALFRPSETTPEGIAAAKAFDDRQATIVSEVNKALAPLGLKDVRVKFENFLKEKTGAGQEVFPQGFVNEAGNVISLATNIYDPSLNPEQTAQKVVEIMNHEVIHSLVNLGLFKPGEVKTLFDAVQRTNYPGSKFTYFDRAMNTYGKVYTKEDGTPNMEMIVEEGVAEMFRDWNAGRLKLAGKPEGLFQRMLEFLKRIFRGFKSAKVDDVFRAIKAGEMGAREGKPAEAGGTKFAIPAQLTGESEQEFARWFKQSVAVNEDGSPKIFYHGRPRPLREGQFNRGASGALPGEEGPYFFTTSKRFAEDYALVDISKGGTGNASETGIMYPVYLSVQNPFDYDSPADMQRLVDYIKTIRPDGLSMPDMFGDYGHVMLDTPEKRAVESKRFFQNLGRGAWRETENPIVQRAIRDLGFDGFFVKENTYKNLAVYKPEQIKSIFNQFEPGTAESKKLSILPRAPMDWATSGSPPPGTDSQNANGISPYRISQRRPTGAKSISSVDNDLEVSAAAMRAAPAAWNHNTNVVLRSYDIFPKVPGEAGEETAQRFIRHVADNLLFLHDMVPAEVRARSKLWYDGARAITTELAQQYSLPDSAVAAVIAAESPQKDWYQNVSLAKRITNIVKAHNNFAFNDEMMEKARELKALKQYEDVYTLLRNHDASIDDVERVLRQTKGNMIAAGQMTEEEFKKAANLAKAIFVRVYDETYNSRDYNIISPEGKEMEVARTKSGNRARVAWGSFTEIAKAISVIEDPSKENIDVALGNKHKVRNFYNNIISPKAGSDVTIDTHAVAAGQLKPFGGGATEVHHNFGTSKKGMPVKVKNSGPEGVQGLYGLYADAYRLAAAERDILPREMQSITWEAVRALFKPEQKRNRQLIQLVNNAWSSYANGNIDINTARNNILEAANAKQGIDNPSWWSRPATVPDEDVREAAESGDVRPDELGAGYEGGEPDSGAVVRDSLATAERVAKQVNREVSKSRTFGGENLDAFARAANRSVSDAVKKMSVLPVDAPMPASIDAVNTNLFAADTQPRTIGETIMGMFGGLGSAAGRTNILDRLRVEYVQKEAQFAKREREAYLNDQLPAFEQNFAEYSAVAAMDMKNRASHYTVEVMRNGAPVVKMINNDPNSMYFEVAPDPDNNPAKVFEIILTSGPNGTSLVKHFRSYAIAQVAKKRLAEGKALPQGITQQYINDCDQLGTTYPQIVDAFTRYQNFNAKLIKAALDAGVIDKAGYDKFLNGMNYYSMYAQFEEEPAVPGTSSSIGSKIKVREYKGGGPGNLMADPISAMMYNVAFWNNAILQNIASQKALRVGESTQLMKRLRVFKNPNGTVSVEQPDTAAGYVDKVFYTKINGIDTPFATKDPLLAVGLMSNPQANLEGVFKYLGMPTGFLREMVTRDPGFMIANLMRDSVATWVLAGSGARPQDTFKSFVTAYRKNGSYDKLRNLAVIGSFDEAQKSPEKFVAGLRSEILKTNGLSDITGALKKGWDYLEKLSEASDAATRIAVYDAAKKSGATDFTAAYRALSIMNFSRSGNSAGLKVLTKLIPFLNARIQGFDVLYNGLKSAAGVATGAAQLDFERQRGTAVLYRSMGLMAGALALAALNNDDDDYKQLPQYMKDANILVPVGGGKYISIPKPFEAGLLFMTIPTAVYEMAAGTRSGRSTAKLFYDQFSSTFGFNPVPQFALPILENITNRDFYTGLPLVSPGQEKLDASLQYNASTSYVARGIGQLLKYTPMGYNADTGRFEGVSPILLDNLISGYGGPIASYLGMAVGGITTAFGTDGQGLPVAGSNLPIIRRFFVDAQDKQPQAAADAYELYQQVDKVTRTVSRLKKMGDVEALKEYRAENIDILRVGKQVRKMADNLNNIRAQLRRLEANTTMSGQEKLAKMRELRSREITLTRKIDEINQKLGR